jgi:hypothetical protein
MTRPEAAALSLGTAVAIPVRNLRDLRNTLDALLKLVLRRLSQRRGRCNDDVLAINQICFKCTNPRFSGA